MTRRGACPRGGAHRGCAMNDVSSASCAGITVPVIGASKPGQLEAAVAALDVKLSSDEIARLEAPYEPHPVLRHP